MSICLADYHTHTRCSPDAAAPMTEMAAAAVGAGLDEICFTDHVEPLVWGPGTPLEQYDWAALTADFQEAQKAWGGRIRLRLGVELGDAPWNFAHTEKLMAQAPELDFVIGSIHLLSETWERRDLSRIRPATEEIALEIIRDYLGEVRKLAEWGGFNVLGHLTLPLRYFNGHSGYHLTFDPFEDEVRYILTTLVQNGRGIEVNTNRGRDPLPGEKWLRIYRELGGEIVTLGSDAHGPDMVGCAIRERQELLRACGFTRFCTFDRGQPVWRRL